MEAATIEKGDRLLIERGDLDFPIYKDERSGNRELILLALGFLLPILQSAFPSAEESSVIVLTIRSLLFFALPVVPLMIALHGEVGRILQKPKLSDFGLIILGALVMYVVSIGMVMLLVATGIVEAGSIHANPVVNQTHDFVFWLRIIFQLFGEEAIKVNMLLFILTLVYRYTGKRKLGVTLGVVIGSLIFGLMHMGAYHNLAQVLFVQGLSAMVNTSLYVRTKNIGVSYGAHLLFDFIPIALG